MTIQQFSKSINKCSTSMKKWLLKAIRDRKILPGADFNIEYKLHQTVYHLTESGMDKLSDIVRDKGYKRCGRVA